MGPGILTDYLEAAMSRAQLERLEDGDVGASISGLVVLWAVGETEDLCRAALRSALENGVLVSLKLGHELPVLAGIDLNRAGRLEAAVAVLIAGRPQAPPETELGAGEGVG